MSRIRFSLLASVVLSGFVAAASHGAQAQDQASPTVSYALKSETKFAGQKVGWDYLNFDAGSRRLFIARRDAGIWAYSPDTGSMTMVKQSENTNGVALAPDLGRGYTTNRDGSTTIFDLKSLAPIARMKVAEDNDANIYDAATRQVVFVNGDSNSVTLLRTQDNKVAGKVVLDSEKPEFPAVDGTGTLFVALQDKNVIGVIDLHKQTMTARWPTTGCTLPTATRMIPGQKRLLVGCRGDKPVLLVMDTTDGHVVSTLPIGHGVDAVQYDPGTGSIFASAGVDSSVTVIHAGAADSYRVVDTVGTRPMARTMAIDPKTGALYLVTAEYNILPPKDGKKPVTVFRPGSFVLLTYTKQ